MCDRCERRERARMYYRRRTEGTVARTWRRPTVQSADEVAIERAMIGDRVELSAADCYEVVRRLTEEGRSSQEIAVLIGVSRRTVTRYRSRPQPVVEPCAQVDEEAA